MSLSSRVTKLYASDDFIDSFYLEREFYIDELHENFHLDPGSLIQIVSENNEKKSALLYVTADMVKLCNSEKKVALGEFAPRDKNQLWYFNLLNEEDFKIVVSLGTAGTGKTSIAIAKAVDLYFKQRKTIYLTKPTHMVQDHENQVFGPVPGDVEEKYAPYLGSFEIVLKKVLGSEGSSYLDSMKKKKHLQYIPVEYTRGCTFEDCTFIIDEVQNMTWHELKTVMSRIGENSKLILCGDPYQIDSNMSLEQTGIYNLLTSDTFLASDITTSVTLTKQYRGVIPDLIYHIDKEMKG